MDAEDFRLPPGCKTDILGHPSGANRSVEIAIFQEHRYAFFFWAAWTRKLGLQDSPPALVTLDWHEDLCPIDEDEEAVLQALNLDDRRAVSLCCWETLSSLNDGHIAAAIYLNLIGDVYAVRKQANTTEDEMQDQAGRVHRIRCFDTVDALMQVLNVEQVDHAYFDVDLDFFTESSDWCGGGDHVELVEADVVRATLDPVSPLMRWVFQRFCGMTIATEPEFCGGVVNSGQLMAWVNAALFKPQLLSRRPGWRHLG